jgi:hypothetical protein
VIRDTVAGAAVDTIKNVAAAVKANSNNNTSAASEGAVAGLNGMRTDSARKMDPVSMDPVRTVVEDSVTRPVSAAVAVRPAYKPGNVVKVGERKLAKSWRLVYADKGTGKKADTIVVIIPVDTTVAVARNKVAVKKPGIDSSVVKEGGVTVIPEKKEAALEKKDAKPIDSGKAAVVHAAVTPAVVAPVPAAGEPEKKPAGKVVLVNSDCKNFATEYDVDKLRVKMLEAGKDEDRITSAKKIFKTKCFTTRQVRALSEVFTNDGVKFRFFETAYPFVSDDKFGELAGLLADPVYNSKFKAMTGQR